MSTLMALVFVGMGALPVGPGSHQWYTDYAKALTATQEQQKPLLITIDNPKTVRFITASSDSVAADGELKKFVLCRVDLSTPYGAEVARRFKATEFPFTAIIDKNGKYVMFKKTGSWQNPTDLTATLARFHTVGLSTSQSGKPVGPTSSPIRSQPATSSFQFNNDPFCFT